VQALTSADRRCDPVTGLALQSAIPVNVRRVEPSVDVDASLALAHSLERVSNLDVREAVKVGVPRIDRAYPVLVHQSGRVRVVKQVPANS
jgi:hypothetical protein